MLFALVDTGIEYSCPSVCLPVCMLICVHNNQKNYGSINLKFDLFVVYGKSLDEFDIAHGQIKVKVMVRL